VIAVPVLQDGGLLGDQVQVQDVGPGLAVENIVPILAAGGVGLGLRSIPTMAGSGSSSMWMAS